MVFDCARWMNHPSATYRAENKAVQLGVASRVGFAIPPTIITNDSAIAGTVANEAGRVALKALDTFIISRENSETFGYTNQLDEGVVKASDLSTMPVIAQRSLDHKLDLRVTVVGDSVFTAAIRVEGKPVAGDWRLQKQREFSPHELPRSIERQCVALTRDLGLSFGAIDLALQDDCYLFLEINPTGEWAWLVDDLGFAIDATIAEQLASCASPG